MKTVAFIPVKLNNERTPGKNVKPFSDGTPLMRFVQLSLVQLKEEGIIDSVFCFCSDEEVKSNLIPGVDLLIRPQALDKKETKGREIYETFVDMIEADVYVLAHATSPFVRVDHIRECILKVQGGEFDSAFCGEKHQAFFWQNGKPVNFDLSNPPRTQDMVPFYTEITTPYVFTKETFQRYHARTGIHPYICECSAIEGIDIDYPEDFLLADCIYMNMIKENTDE